MRKTLIILTSLCVVGLLAYCGYRAYGLWKQNHWMTLARRYAMRADTRNEYLALEQVLKANQRNLEAIRMMANLAEMSHSPSTLLWRQKAVELAPNSLDDRLALAQTAIFAHDFDTAMTALNGTDAAGKKTATYFNISADLALAMNKPDEALADYTEASRLDPNNPALQVSVAVMQLHETNALDVAQARITLRRLSLNITNSYVGNQARRELIMDALQHQDNQTAATISRELVQQPNIDFADKLLNLDCLKAVKNDDFNSAFAACESEAAGNSDKLFQITSWMMQRNMPGAALSWMRTLPANVQTNMPAVLLAVQCEIAQQNWKNAQDLATHGDWGNVDYSRHAYLSYVLRQQGLSGGSKAEWDLALKAATHQSRALQELFDKTVHWNWPDEAQQVLWAVVNTYPQEKWAPPILVQQLYVSGNTRPLMQLFSIETSRNPNDFDAKNNLAMMAMLLGASELKPYVLARDAYDHSPTNTSYIATYAYALHLQGRDADAVKLFQSVPPEAFNDSATAGYYGVILTSSGDRNKAKPYLRRATEGTVLPEERTLFERALTGL